MQLIFPRLLLPVRFHNRPRHDAYLELLCQLLISVQVVFPLLAEGHELRVLGHPVCEVVFGEDGEVSALSSGASYEVGGSGEIVGGVEGLRGKRVSVGGWGDEGSLTEMEDLRVELDEGDVVRGCHGGGLCMFIGRSQAHVWRGSFETWRGN